MGDSEVPASAAARSRAIAIAVSKIMLGCCTNVLTLEMITKRDPGCGHFLTALQFASVIAVSALSQLEWRSVPLPALTTSTSAADKTATQRKLWFPTLPERHMPLLPYLLLSIIFGAQSIINNIVFSYSISVPLQTVFRSSSLPVSLLIGYFCFKRSYTLAQAAACFAVAAGVVIVTFADAAATAAATVAATVANAAPTVCSTCDPLASLATASLETATATASASVAAATKTVAAAAGGIGSYTIGIILLTISLVLSALLGHLQQSFAAVYSAPARESLLYSHAVYMPAFLLMWDQVWDHAKRWGEGHLAAVAAAASSTSFATATAASSMTPVAVSLTIPASAPACASLLASIASTSSTAAPLAAAAAAASAAQGGLIAGAADAVCSTIATSAASIAAAAASAAATVTSAATTVPAGSVTIAAASAASTGEILWAWASEWFRWLCPLVLTLTPGAAAGSAAVATLSLSPLLALLLNVSSQFLCVSGVYALTAQTSTTTTTLAITVRKFVSVIVSVIIFQNPFTAGHWAGSSLVFLGAALYMFGGPSRSSKPASSDSSGSSDTPANSLKTQDQGLDMPSLSGPGALLTGARAHRDGKGGDSLANKRGSNGKGNDNKVEHLLLLRRNQFSGLGSEARKDEVEAEAEAEAELEPESELNAPHARLRPTRAGLRSTRRATAANVIAPASNDVIVTGSSVVDERRPTNHQNALITPAFVPDPVVTTERKGRVLRSRSTHSAVQSTTEASIVSHEGARVARVNRRREREAAGSGKA